MSDQRLLAAADDPANWLSHGRDYAEQRFSPLDDINSKTIHKLGLEWVIDTGTKRGLQATPIVVDGIMYVTLTWSVLIAIDAATGEQLWRFDPKVNRRSAYYACCDVVNRGAAVWGDNVYIGTLDGRLISVNAKTGQQNWAVATTNTAMPYTITGAPRIVKGKVVIGNAGADFGVRGYVSAYDAIDGRLLWRFYTVPGNPDSNLESQAMNDAMDTWSGQWWKLGGGGAVWDAMAYDPELDLLYIGVGSGSPWNPKLRSPAGGDNLFLSSIVAIRPDDGSYVWHYQTTPAEKWGYSAAQHIMLADLMIQGELRKVLMQAPENGFFYLIDRVDGSLISAEKYAQANWASHIDIETGRPVLDKAADYTQGPKYVYPSSMGAHNWQPMAFQPQYELVFIPMIEQGARYSADDNFIPIKGINTGVESSANTSSLLVSKLARQKMHQGYILAWDPLLQKARWRVAMEKPWVGGLLATAGNLLFMGHADGYLRAYRADVGEEIWRADTQIGLSAAPVSYSVDGEQYIAVLAGWGGTQAMVSKPESTEESQSQGRILAYKLNGKTKLPAKVPVNAMAEPLKVTADESVVDTGQYLYARHCGRCHGADAVSHSTITDLRYSSLKSQSEFDEVVLKGSLADSGMA